MNVTGLFAGIGGFEVGLESAGHRTVFVSELSEVASAVLQARLPGAQPFGDVRMLEGLPAATELVTAGFPCQDLSQAGRTRGLAGTRSSLVGEVLRLAERGRPPWILMENVPFMLQLARGAALRKITAELEKLGYRWCWRVVDAFGFGLPQRRERVLLLASIVADPADVLLVDDTTLPRPATDIGRIAHGFYWTEGRGGLGWAADAVPTLKTGSSVGIPSPPAMLLADGLIVKPDLRDAERLQGFPEDWTKPAEAVGRPNLRWGLVGNAVAPPVAAWIGRRLADPGPYDRARDKPFPVTGRLPRAARSTAGGAVMVEIGPDPLGLRPPSLAAFLRYGGEPLSARATAGFLSRTRGAKLRFAPGFIEAVEAHLTHMGETRSSEERNTSIVPDR